MRIQTIKRTIELAERFARLAREIPEIKNNKLCSGIWGSKQSGAARRASMELTRALADMRQDR